MNEEKLFDSNRTDNSFIKLLDNDAVHFLDEDFIDEIEAQS